MAVRARPQRQRALQPRDRPDAELVASVASGDPAAFELLYDRYAKRVFSYAHRLTRRSDLAEELTQEVFLALWRHADRFQASQGSLFGWLLTITRRRVIDLRRREERGARALEAHAGTAARPTPDPTLDGAQSRIGGERVAALLADLPPEQREAVVLAVFDGLTHVEIAARTGAPPGTVKGRIRLGLTRLGRTLRAEP